MTEYVNIIYYVRYKMRRFNDFFFFFFVEFSIALVRSYFYFIGLLDPKDTPRNEGTSQNQIGTRRNFLTKNNSPNIVN